MPGTCLVAVRSTRRAFKHHCILTCSTVQTRPLPRACTMPLCRHPLNHKTSLHACDKRQWTHNKRHASLSFVLALRLTSSISHATTRTRECDERAFEFRQLTVTTKLSIVLRFVGVEEPQGQLLLPPGAPLFYYSPKLTPFVLRPRATSQPYSHNCVCVMVHFGSIVSVNRRTPTPCTVHAVLASKNGQLTAAHVRIMATG